jgi:hypothetical protein
MRKGNSNAGAPSILDDPTTITKIDNVVMSGGWINEIAEALDTPWRTVQDWYTRDFRNFRAKIRAFKRDYLVKKAERNIDEMLDLDVTEPIVTMVGIQRDEEGNIRTKTNTNKLKVKADISKFVAETLGKEEYSKRNEHTGKGGDQLMPTPIYGGKSKV